MQTRRQTNLAGIPIRDLLLPRGRRRRRDAIKERIVKESETTETEPEIKWTARLEEAREKQRILEQQIERLKVDEKRLEHIFEPRVETIKENVEAIQENANNAVIKTNETVATKEREETKTTKTTKTTEKETEETEATNETKASNGKNGTVFLVIDTESFKFGHNLLPLQIAWCVYHWNGENNELQQISAISAAYVAEIISDPVYRDVLEEELPWCLKKHDNNMRDMSEEAQSASDILQNLERSIREHGVSTLVGYNVSWDFAALANMILKFSVNLPTFSGLCNNPFNPMRLDYLDLMHETVKKYGKQLAASGVEDGTIHRASESNRLMLRKNTRYGKSIYSAAYVLQSFFGVKQEHLAEHDVQHEAMLLQKCIQDFGLAALEYNVCYPQANCYQMMLHWANELYVDPISIDDEPENFSRYLRKKKRKPSNSPDDDVCLFDTSDDEAPTIVPAKDKGEAST